MTLLNEKDRAAIQSQLAESLQHPVELALFVSQEDCEYCDLTQQLLAELAELHGDLTLAVYDLQSDAAYARQLGVERAPAIVVLGGVDRADYGIRFYGIPSGYEFASVMEDIRLVGSGDARLQPATRDILAQLSAPVHLQVFVTPSCPYCPQAVVLAHRLAYASPHVSADGVEVSEFPELGDRYGVMGVPHTVIDDIVHVSGAVPEGALLAKLREALRAEVAA